MQLEDDGILHLADLSRFMSQSALVIRGWMRPQREQSGQRKRHAVNKKTLSESDICDQYITPAIVAAGWDMTTQMRREFGFTAGRVDVHRLPDHLAAVEGRYRRRVLFLADRNIVINLTITNDFKPFGSVMRKVRNRTVDKSCEVYLALYQAVSGTEEEKNVYKQFSPDFFDMVVIDECHRGSAREDSAWRENPRLFRTSHSAWTHRHIEG